MDEETGLYYYGARYMNPVASIWYGVDPLAEKYVATGGYVYTLDNPVKLVDSDGRKIYLVGSRQERTKMLSTLQKLTNDKLFVNRKTGEVTIEGKRWDNRNRSLRTGTSLIREIMKSDKEMDIQLGSRNHEHDNYPKDASNGKGSDVTVFFNSDSETYIVRDSKGNIKEEESTDYINMGHELIHGYRSMNGFASPYEDETKYIYENPNHSKYMKNESTEELKTVGIIKDRKCSYTENSLRKEHFLPERIKY